VMVDLPEPGGISIAKIGDPPLAHRLQMPANRVEMLAPDQRAVRLDDGPRLLDELGQVSFEVRRWWPARQTVPLHSFRWR
jgi:hypothetical protein